MKKATEKKAVARPHASTTESHADARAQEGMRVATQTTVNQPSAPGATPNVPEGNPNPGSVGPASTTQEHMEGDTKVTTTFDENGQATNVTREKVDPKLAGEAGEVALRK